LTELGYQLADAYSHYYEPDDCFTRHMERRYLDRAVHIVRQSEEPGLVHVGERALGILPTIPGDTSLAPDVLRDVFEGRTDPASLRSRLPVNLRQLPTATDRDACLAWMDDQGVALAIVLPSLGGSIEHEMHRDVEGTYASIRAFNRWLNEDWGLTFHDRIFAVPLMSLLDVDQGACELEWVLSEGARLIHIKHGFVYGRSPADPVFDPFWARVNESGTRVVFYASDSGYNELISTLWGEKPNPPIWPNSAFQMTVCGMQRSIMDTMAALVLHNLSGRFPDIRVLCIESGSSWVRFLLREIDGAVDTALQMGNQVDWLGGLISDRASDIFRHHVYVSPFFPKDVPQLVRVLGASHVLFGSDHPHAEGLAAPVCFADGLAELGLSAADIRYIMRDNLSALVQARTPERQ
jgi:predicted TIM-barrel fold metal-dependent hydrolase